MRNSTLLPAVLDTICSTDMLTCQGVMDSYAAQIAQPANCGQDISKGNALAVAALNGFRNFRLYREAGCLKDAAQDSEGYCFARAAGAATAR